MMSESKKSKKVIVFMFLIIIFIVYVVSPYRIEYINYRDKVWAHRVNTINKLKYTQKVYHGIELDLVYNLISNSFDVNHPPSPSINLNLDNYLGEINNKDINIWFDIKNLSEHNVKEASLLLNDLVEKHQFNKQKILIESPQIALLKPFGDKNFKTSFYLPQLYGLESNELLDNRLDSIKLLLSQYPTTAISCNANSYPIISIHFKEKQKYLWNIYNQYSPRQIKKYGDLRKQLADSTVCAVLVKVALPVGSR